MRILLAWLLFAVAGLAAEPSPSIRLPDIPQPAPAPVVTPDTPVKLLGETLYVVDSDLPLVVLCSPAGVLKVTEEAGPIKIRGVFAGNEKSSTRTFKGKHVYTVEVADGKSGRCELLIVPTGIKTEAEVIRRLIDANTGPQPPPIPPKPDPDPKPDPVVWPESPLIVVVIEETEQASNGRGAFFADAALTARMVEKGHKWRAVDQNVVGPDGRPPADIVRFLEAAKGKSLPQVFLVDGKGKTRHQGDCPAKASDLIAQLKKVGG